MSGPLTHFVNMENLSPRSKFAQAFGESLHKSFSDRMDRLKQQQDLENREKQLLLSGYPPALARIAAQATTGGQTEVTKYLIDQMARGEGGQDLGMWQPQQQAQMQQQQQIPQEQPVDEISQKLSELPRETGLKSSERVTRENARYKTNLPSYQEAAKQIKGLEENEGRYEILQKINESGKLPKNLGRLNVDSEGNLRFAFASTPEAERYQKTLNEFSANAKDTYGSRVTNFDLQQYLKRFPTLMNSEEGRKQILQQMRLVNKINKEYYGTLKKVYDKAGGVRKIDDDVARRIAEDVARKKIDKLVAKFGEIGQITSLPSASEHKGRKIKDEETGKILISDGNEWIPQ